MAAKTILSTFSWHKYCVSSTPEAHYTLSHIDDRIDTHSTLHWRIAYYNIMMYVLNISRTFCIDKLPYIAMEPALQCCNILFMSRHSMHALSLTDIPRQWRTAHKLHDGISSLFKARAMVFVLIWVGLTSRVIYTVSSLHSRLMINMRMCPAGYSNRIIIVVDGSVIANRQNDQWLFEYMWRDSAAGIRM